MGPEDNPADDDDRARPSKEEWEEYERRERLRALPKATCYLQEEDPPADHDIEHYSCVCGRCYGALADLETAAQKQVTALRKLLMEVLEAPAVWGHGHWDWTQQSGAGCPMCIAQREIRDKITEALKWGAA